MLPAILEHFGIAELYPPQAEAIPLVERGESLLLAVPTAAGKTLVAGALQRFEGQLSTFKSHLGGDNPCYRCLFPTPPPPGSTPRCETAGIFGSIAGVIGTMQATEILKELLGLGDSLSGNLVLYDALGTNFRKIRVPPDPNCALCGPQATIKGL